MKHKKGVKTPAYTVFGLHAVEKALTAGRVTTLWCDAQRQDLRMQALTALASMRGVAFRAVDKTALSDLVGAVRHQGVVAHVEPPPTFSERHLETVLQEQEKPFLLLLDQVQDPHNLGACLRTAHAVGAHAVITPKDRAAGMTPVVYKTACGAAEFTPVIQVTNFARAMKDLQSVGMWLVGADDAAERSLYAQDLRASIGIVLGAEGPGLRRKTAQACDFLVSIPMLGQVESLNVSVAAGVLLYECVRQRQQT